MTKSSAVREQRLDLLKGLGAIAVVMLHAPPLYHSGLLPLKGLGWIVRELCQIAVPLFFMISGYLAGRREAVLPGGVRTFRRLALLYIPWFIVYLAIDATTGRDLEPALVLRRFVGFSEAEASTSGYHLWFLPAMAWAFLLLRITIAMTGGWKLAAWVGLAIFFATGLTTGLNGEMPWNMAPHEGINISLLCLSLGYGWGEHLRTGGRFPPARSMWLAAAGAWLLAEAWMLGAWADEPWLIPGFQSGRILLPLLLLMAASRRDGGTDSRTLHWLPSILASTSTGIYVMHVAFLELIPFDRLVPMGFVRDNLVRWPAALIGSATIAWFVVSKGPRAIRGIFS